MEEKEKYAIYCGNCSNLMKVEFLGKQTVCCAGNVNYPEKCCLRKEQK